MSSNAATRILAGVMLALSIALSLFVDLKWLFLTTFVGANLTQSSWTGFCPATMVLERLGFPEESSEEASTIGKVAARIVGLVVLSGLATGYLTSMWPVTFAVTAVVAVSYAQSAWSGWCPALALARSLSRTTPAGATH